MDPSDSSQQRRKIPAVSDVVAELSRRLLASPEQQPMLFRVAQQVCAEELRLVKTGFQPSGFDELVERAMKLLPSEMGRDAFPEAEPFAGGSAPIPVPGPAGEGPFSPEPFEPIETYEPPTAPIEPLALPESAPPPRTPAIPRYRGGAHSERHGRSMSVMRILIFLALIGIGYGGFRLSQSGAWPFRAAKMPSPASPRRPAPRPAPAESSRPALPRSEATSTSIAANPPARRPAPVPPGVNPRPVETRAVPAVPPSAGTAPSEAAGLPESRGGSMISKDWDGRAPAYMIHFSSYQRRENAERDQVRLSKLLGGSFHIISVNLGREGFWFRVMLGDFSSRDEALALRQRLAEKHTEGMGLVYKVSGTR